MKKEEKEKARLEKNREIKRYHRILKILLSVFLLLVFFNAGLFLGIELTKRKYKTSEINIKGSETSSYTTMQDLKGRIDSKEIRILDTRVSEDYQKEHIKNARSIPSSQLKTRLDEVPKDLQIIVYGKSLGDREAMNAYNVLFAANYDVRSLLGGIDEWAEAGYPVEK